jgi:hypothetical protein
MGIYNAAAEMVQRQDLEPMHYYRLKNPVLISFGKLYPVLKVDLLPFHYIFGLPLLLKNWRMGWGRGWKGLRDAKKMGVRGWGPWPQSSWEAQVSGNVGLTATNLTVLECYTQCSGSMDPCLRLMDPDPDADQDPAIFVIDLQKANKKLIFLIKFFCLLGTFWRYIYIIF